MENQQEQKNPTNFSTPDTLGQTVPQPDTTNNIQTPQQRMSVGQIYPSVPTAQPQNTATVNPNSHIGLTGSSMQQQKSALPKGIYVIVAWNLLGVALDFLNTSQTGVLATFILLGNLLLSIGLLLRMDIVRQILVVLYAITILAGIANIVLLVGLQNRTNSIEAQYQAATAKFRNDSATSEQKKHVAALDKLLAETQEKANGVFLVGYIRQGATVAVSIAIIKYLTRPNIKEAFEPSDSKV